MILLNKEEVSAITINPDLVVSFKVSGDTYLNDIKRTLSKQLVYYMLYYELQQMFNSYFRIIDKLLNEKYSDISQLRKDHSLFKKDCSNFLKTCQGFIDDDVLEEVTKNTDQVDNLILKLVYIAENICSKKPEEVQSNEIRSISQFTRQSQNQMGSGQTYQSRFFRRR